MSRKPISQCSSCETKENEKKWRRQVNERNSISLYWDIVVVISCNKIYPQFRLPRDVHCNMTSILYVRWAAPQTHRSTKTIHFQKMRKRNQHAHTTFNPRTEMKLVNFRYTLQCYIISRQSCVLFVYFILFRFVVTTACAIGIQRNPTFNLKIREFTCSRMCVWESKSSR